MSIRSMSRSQSSQLNLKQIKSQMNDDDYLPSKIQHWYEQKCKSTLNPLSSSVPLMRNSDPFRLTLHKISGIPSTKKPANHQQYLQLTCTLINEDMSVIGKTCSYQCEQAVNTNGIYNVPVCFYYHSRIDRGFNAIKMLVGVTFLQTRNGIVQICLPMGVGVIDSPFLQCQKKQVKILKDSNETDLCQNIGNNQSSSMSFTFSIQTGLQLKSITKFIPSQLIVSPQDEISGIKQEHLPVSPQQPIEQGEVTFVKISAMQIHILDKFQSEVINQIKSLPTFNKTSTSFTKKIVIGYHNQYQIVAPIKRNLQQKQKMQTGDSTVIIYQSIGEQQIIKVPYFHSENKYSCAIAVSLVYSDGSSEYEVSLFAFSPNLQSRGEQLSMSMISGVGQGFVSSLLPLKSAKSPTIIIQYRPEEQKISSNKRNESQRPIKMPSGRLDLREEQQQIKQLQRKNMLLQKQNQELQMLKTNHNLQFQQKFERRLQDEKENLKLRLQMIENHYIEQVQREIRNKVQLERQIQNLKERLIAIEQKKIHQANSQKPSYEQSQAQAESEDGFYNEQQNYRTNAAFFAQRMNAQHFLEQQKTIPIDEVRQIMNKTFSVPQQTIQKQMSNFSMASKFTFTFNSLTWPHQNQLPSSIYFVIRFFNFGQFKTDSLCPLSTGSQHKQLIRQNSKDQNQKPSYSFTIDPSEYSSPQTIHQDLVMFLAHNHTIVDIFDQNYLYIGQANIKMGQLLRGSKSQVLLAKQYRILNKGHTEAPLLQVLIKNQAVSCKNAIDPNTKQKVNLNVKKIVSNSSMIITPEIIKTENNNMSAKSRQQQRIQMFKKKMQQNKKFDDRPINQKAQLMQKISEVKQKNMPQFISRVYEQLLADTITISPQVGQAKTFTYQFTNQSEGPCSFKVNIQSGNQNLTLIKQSEEWKYLVSKFNYPSPRSYDSVNEQGSFYLGAGHSIPLLFRYLSFQQNVQNDELIAVTITKQQNNFVAGGFSLKVNLHHCILNHSYTIYQAAGQGAQLILPVLYSSDQVRTPKVLYSTLASASAQWLSQYQILLKVGPSEPMSNLKFNLLLHEDQHFCSLKQNWLINLHIYEGVYTLYKPHYQNKFKLTLPPDVISKFRPLSLHLHSSHPQLTLMTPELKGVQLLQTQIWCQIYSQNVEPPSSIQVTCVTERKQLVYGWIIQMYPHVPRVV